MMANLQPRVMKNLFPILVVLLFAALGCKYLSPGQKLESETAMANPKRTLTDSPVFLNSEPVGTIADLKRKKTGDLVEIALSERPLSEKLAEITKQRENEGVLIEGTNIAPTNVRLIASPELAVGPLAELYIAIDENSGEVYIPRRNAPAGPIEPQRPDPFTLEVQTEQPTSMSEPYYRPSHDPKYKYNYNTSFEFAKTLESLLSYRAWSGSVELSADERYFVNDAQDPEADEGPKYTRIKQRAIEGAHLKDELARIVEPVNSEILIITSEKASYESLLKIFEAGENLKVRFRVVVRPQKFEKPQN